RALGDLAHLKQVGTQLRSFLDLIASPPQHCAHRREDLTEVVVQLTRDMPQGGFLGGDQLLRQITSLVRKRSQLMEEQPIGADQIKAGQYDGDEYARHENIRLTLHALVNSSDLGRSSLFTFIVLYEQSRYCRTQRSQPSLQRNPDLLARLGLLATRSFFEGAPDRIPELRERTLQIALLVFGPALGRNLLFMLKRILKISPHALELRTPGGQRIVLPSIQRAGIEHVSHRHADRIQLILNSQKLQRVLAVPVNQIILQPPQAPNSVRDVSRVRHNRRQSDQKADIQRSCRRSPQ